MMLQIFREGGGKNMNVILRIPRENLPSMKLFIFYSTTKHEILQICYHNLLRSLDPPNQGWLF